MENNSENPLEDINETVKKIDNVWVQVEKERPSLKLGVLIGAVAIGSYLGVGRHVAKAAKDVKAIRQTTVGISQILVAEMEHREAQRVAIETALELGQKFTHYPGLGVMIGSAGKAVN